MTRIAIHGGLLVDPNQNLCEPGSLYIADGKIVGQNQAPQDFCAEQTLQLDADTIVSPGWIDSYARLREPGYSQKGSIASETAAAVHSGITHLITPPDTRPVLDQPAALELAHRAIHTHARCHVDIIGALTHGLDGQQLAEMAALQQRGCIGLSNADQPIADSRVLRRAFEYASTFDLLVVLQPRDAALSAGAVAQDGAVAQRLGLICEPPASEAVALVQIIELARDLGTRVHISRLRTRRGVEILRRAREDKLPISADVGIAHLWLDERALDGYDSNCHILPPLGHADDCAALRQGLADGVIDAICSNHAPHEADAKLAPFPDTAPGMSTLDVFAPLVCGLGQALALPPQQWLNWVSCAPAHIFNLPVPELSIGAKANISIVSPQRRWQLSEPKSAGRNTPWLGQTLTGQALATLVDGQLAYCHESLQTR